MRQGAGAGHFSILGVVWFGGGNGNVKETGRRRDVLYCNRKQTLFGSLTYVA